MDKLSTFLFEKIFSVNNEDMKYLFFPTNIGIRGYSKKRYVSIFIDENGKNRINTKTFKKKFCIDIPFIRGLIYFFFGIFAILNSFGEALKIQTENIDKEIKRMSIKTKKTLIYSFSILIALIFSLLLLGYVPSKLSFLILGQSKNFILRNFVIALTKVGIIYITMLILRFIPTMQELYKFNGAINQVNNNDKYAHKSLNFLNFFVFVFILSTFVITLIGVGISFWLNWIINLSIFLILVSLSYEFLWLISRDSRVEKNCIITSLLVSMHPNTTHEEIAKMLYSQLAMKDNYYGDKMENGEIALSTLLAEMQMKLTKAGKYDKSDVDWIIATVLGKNRAEAKLVRSFDEKTYREIMKATEQRAQGKPLSAIFGFVEFYGMRFNINRKVLAPRMETEILVEEIIKAIDNIKKCEILDIGTGSGAIAISVAKNSQAKVYAIDVSKQALDVAKENAKKNQAKVEFICSDLFENLKNRKKFDIIASNPPYIPSADIEGLDEEVKKYDPRLALDGGKDGLDFYRKIIKEAPIHLKKNGLIFFEIGKGQFSAVKKLLEKNGFFDVQGIKDYNKIYRVVKAKYGNGK